MKARGYQLDTIERTERALEETKKPVLVVMPTGTGKTGLSAFMIKSRLEKFARKPMFLAPRREIVRQTSLTLTRLAIECGIIMAGNRESPRSPVQVASVDTLRSWVRRGRVRLHPGDLLFVDEAHRSLTPTHRWLIDAYCDHGADVVGLTATPIRADGAGLGQVYGTMIDGIRMTDAIRGGWLVQPDYRVPYVPDLSGVESRGGDYVERALEKVMNKKQLVGDIIDNWLKNGCRGRPTLVFACSVDHSIAIADAFRSIGIRAEHIDGGTDHALRDDHISQFGRGGIEVITNCAVFTEGTDLPGIEVIIDAGPTKSLGRHIQKIGRGTRPIYAPGFDMDTVEGRLEAIRASTKPRFLVLDHAGNFYRHGRVDRNIPWELTEGKEIEEKARAKRERSPAEFTCRECSKIFSGQLYCPECGTKILIKGKMADYAEGDLVKLTNGQFERIEETITTIDQKKFYLGALHWAREPRTKRRKSDPDRPRRKDGFASILFKQKFGSWPPRSWQSLSPVPPSTEVLNYIRHQNIRYTKSRQKAAS